MEFLSRCCFCERQEKRTDKLSMRQQSIYCVKNARNTLSRKHCLIVLYFMDWSNFFFLFYFSNLDSVGECEVFSPEPVDHNANFTSMSEVKKQSNGDDLVGYISTLFTGFA